MPNNIVTQWVEISQASLNALKQMSEANTGNTSALQPPFSTGDLATLLKASLESTKQLSDISTAVFTNLFRNQVNSQNFGVATTAMQSLTDMNTNFVSSFVQQQMKTVNDFSAMFNAYLSDLKKAQGANDISILQIDFLNDLEQKFKDSATDTINILNSAKAAATVWTQKTLDQASSK